MRALVLQFLFESNTFNRLPAELPLFTAGGTWLDDPGAIRKWSRQTPSQMSGSLAVLESAGWSALPTLAVVCGSPAGRLSHSAFATIRAAFAGAIQPHLPADGIILHLHGAACAEGEDDVEGALIDLIRTTVGYSGPLVISLDLHANITRRMVEMTDAVTAYRTMPHTDFVETGERAARLLISHRPNRSVIGVRMAALIPPTDTHHAHGPFSEVLSRARQLEKLPGIDDVSLFPVQPWLAIEELGSSVVVTGGDRILARAQALKLAGEWYGQRSRWLTGLAEWTEILPRLLERRRPGWILVDSADATTGGSDGHSAEAVRRLLPLQDTIPGPALLWVVDPAVVARARAGRRSFLLGRPAVELDAEVEILGEVAYRAKGGVLTGSRFNLGSTVVLGCGFLRIVVSSNPTFGADPAFYEAAGLNPDEAQIIQVKSPMGWRAGFGAAAERGLIFDGPGQTSLDFRKLDYGQRGKSVFPITENPPEPLLAIE